MTEDELRLVLKDLGWTLDVNVNRQAKSQTVYYYAVRRNCSAIYIATSNNLAGKTGEEINAKIRRAVKKQ